MITPLLRVLPLAAACLAPHLGVGPVQARERSVSDFHGPAPEYQRAITGIIYRRMLANRYRTLSGGVSTIAFVLKRDGTVTASTIVKSSGSPYIDALAMAAVPVGYVFPPFPPDLKISRLNVQVPLRFDAMP